VRLDDHLVFGFSPRLLINACRSNNAKLRANKEFFPFLAFRFSYLGKDDGTTVLGIAWQYD
jgi:hypothetical protein